VLRQIARLFLCGLILSSAVAPALAQDDQTFVDVTLNGVDKGQAVVVLVGNDVLMLPKNLDAYGIPNANGQRRTFGDDSYVSLNSLAPAVRFTTDMVNFRLDLTVAASQFGAHDITLQPQSGTPGDPHPSAFLNYAGTFDSLGDAGLSAQIGLHRNNAVFSTGGSLQTGDIMSRALTFVAFDDVPNMKRTQLGDSLVSSDALVGGGTIVGVSSSRQFSLDPYAYIFPQPAVIGSIATTGTAQIYVNGGLTQTVQLQPGVFNLSQLPVQAGPNNVSVVVRDAQGLVQTFGTSYFAASSLLRKGLTDYNYSAGFVENPDGETYERNPSATAYYRIGATDEVTYGARFTADSALQSGDVSADIKVGSGALHLAAAASAGRGTAGGASDIELNLMSFSNSINGGVTLRSVDYTTVGQDPPPAAPAQLDLHLSAAQRITSRISLSLLASRRTFADGALEPAQDIFALSLAGNVAPAVTANISLQQNRSQGAMPQTSVYATLVQSLGHRTSLTTTTTGGTGGTGGSVQYRLDPPSSNQGFGYSLQAGAGTLGSAAYVTDHESFADLDGGVTLNTGGNPLAYGNVAGGLVSTGGHTLVSRPIGNGFAVVDVGQPGVQVLFNNSPAGLSGRNGLLVVPAISAYALNSISIDRNALPLGSETEVDRISASSSYLGGTLASLPVRHITYVSGRVRVAFKGTLTIPAYGVMMVGPTGRVQRSSLDGEGNFYFENLAAGRYPASVVYPGGRCTFELSVAHSDQIATDLGEVQCTR
jgi:outer membrane usher protein